mmetsp:Transcript_2288/g.4971  ORF Transcript_2288/g.4971 Transcript_2288/m.4971 type:complete len:93 (+) Transcript_2288:158-436(+)
MLRKFPPLIFQERRTRRGGSHSEQPPLPCPQDVKDDGGWAASPSIKIMKGEEMRSGRESHKKTQPPLLLFHDIDDDGGGAVPPLHSEGQEKR